MKRFTSIVLIMVLCGLNMSAGTKKDLQFNQDGTFKILQFTDTHLCAYNETVLEEAEKTFARMTSIIKNEKPDLLVFTGDVVTSQPSDVMWKRLMDTLDVYNVPFAAMFGNHDHEVGLTRAEISRIIMDYPLNINKLNKAKELADMQIPVMSSNGKKPAAMIYCMDSHDYSKIEGIGGYGWFERGQVDWLYESCMKAAEKAGAPLPSLAFFHIPLPEFSLAFNNQENGRVGVRQEAECHAKVNPGMFAAMIESGSVMGVFCGHDHDNDYVVAEHGIALGYGRYSGDETVYNHLKHGIRVIELKEGERAFSTWIHEDDGTLADPILFKDGKIEKM